MTAQEIQYAMLGQHHERYGEYKLATVSPNTAAAMSIGSDEEFATSNPKQHPNEDALLVIENKRHTVMVVADAHFGRESSEELVQALQTVFARIPETPEALDDVMRGVSREQRGGKHLSETTLLIAIYDRLFRQGFGLSYGDSTLMLARPRAAAEKQNRRNNAFVSLTNPQTLRPRNADHFHWSARPGELMLAFTDGIDECCYREPDRGVSPALLGDLIAPHFDDPKAAADAVVRKALSGVDGWAGGQDNIALIVSKT